MLTAIPPTGTPAPDPLERGEVIFLPRVPFPLPDEADLAFLREQQASGLGRKHICFNPHRGTLTGYLKSNPDQESRLSRVMASFSQAVTDWVNQALPAYQGGIEPDRATFRPEEEATRRLRPHARNDLLHVDAFPGRPARGRRILRIFVNIHPSESRIWATSEPLPGLLPRVVDKIRRSSAGWFHALGARLRAIFRPGQPQQTEADLFMLRLHDYLKSDLDFQQRGPRRLWRFPPGSLWLAMTDACTYAELRGQHALEHSFFISPEVLRCPELAPARLVAAG